MSDIREKIIEERLRNIKRIIAVSSSKGGVGKTLIASVASLLLSRACYKTGLIDLDFTSPSCHIVLACDYNFPEENKGILPVNTSGIQFMSPVLFSKNKAMALRGSDITSMIKEMLAITIWDKLDFLIIDTTPGLSESKVRILGIVENMHRTKSKKIKISFKHSIKTASIGFDQEIERYIGKPEKIIRTRFAKELKTALKNLSILNKNKNG